MKFIVLLCIVLSISTVSCECLKECCKTLAERPALSYTFYQDTGRFTGGTGKWAIETRTYSGQGEGYLNPAKQCVVNVGVLPANTYKLGYCKDLMHETTTRPCSFYLDPQDESKMCGRNDFFIHGCQCCTEGDTTQPPVGGCSAGCIIMNIENRQKLRVGDIVYVVRNDPNKVFLQEMPIEQINA
ncbi:hypothetical protein ABPG72_004082 [Tetrahymena utriculariae]